MDSFEFATRAIHAGQPTDEATGAVTFPIYQTSTYGQELPGVNKGYVYARTGNPGRTAEDHRIRMRSILRPKDGFKWSGDFQ